MDWKWWGTQLLFLLGGAIVGFAIGELNTGAIRWWLKHRKELRKLKEK